MMQHLACIMDGNRRWAKKKGVPLSDGVLEGLARAENAADFCIEKQIPYVSLFAFSIENLQRSVIERECIFNVLVTYGKKYAMQMAAKGACVHIVGDRSLFPNHIKDVCNEIEDITKDGKKLTIQLLFCYGGRQEIVAGLQQICTQVCSGALALESITEQSFKSYLWSGDIPDPDLVVRTGFANRLSNFLTYQTAYSELYFPQCLWPDMTHEEFEAAYTYFMSCKRNFGR
jgi:undecaprenyl diphosphate synthase